MTPSSRDDPIEHDPRLREALRHAPDAQQRPPAALSERILREARAQTPVPSATSRAVRDLGLGAMATLWGWLARPPVAAGFAGIMAATLVGLMWWDQPMDDLVDRPPPPAAIRPAEAPRHAQAPAAPAPSQAATPAEHDTAPLAKEASPRKAAAAEHKEQASRQARADQGVGPGPKANSTTAPDPQVADKPGVAKPERGPVPAPAPAPVTAGATAPAVAPPAAPPMAAAAPPETREEMLTRRQRTAEPVDGGAASRGAPAADAARKLALRDGAQARRTDDRPLRSLSALLATQPAHWSWQLSTDPAPRPVDNRARAIVAAIDQAGALAWRPAQDAGPPPSAPSLRLLHDGAVLHRWWLSGRTLWWHRGDDTPALLQVELSDDAERSLRATLSPPP